MTLQALLLLALAAAAIWPARYLVRHVRAAPHRREIALSAVAYEWRRPYKAVLSAVALVLVAIAFACVSFSDAAAGAADRILIALLGGAVAIPLVVHIADGLRHGRIELYLTLRHQVVEREGHPLFFWYEIAMSAFLALGVVFAVSRLVWP